MNHLSIFSCPPQNETELVVLEKQTQAILFKTLDVNLTKKRANKLRQITCELAGFPNGYQQLLAYWNNKRPQIINDVHTLKSVLAKREGLIVFFGSAPLLNQNATLLMVRMMGVGKDDTNRDKIPEPVKHELSLQEQSKAMLRSDPDLLIMGNVTNSEIAYNAVRAANAGYLVSGTVELDAPDEVINRLSDFGIKSHTASINIYLVSSQSVANY
jgi:hypothetical protein